MNLKNVPSDKPVNYGTGNNTQVKAQNQFKSLPPLDQLKQGSNGVIVHTVGCAGNHLGKC